MTIIYKGKIQYIYDGEADNIISIDSNNSLVEEIKDDIDLNGEFLTVMYHISDKEKTEEELNENLIKLISGSNDHEVDYGHAYSEYTGYLWTNEDLDIGGHDLINELQNSIGKFLYLTIKYDTRAKSN